MLGLDGMRELGQRVGGVKLYKCRMAEDGSIAGLNGVTRVVMKFAKAMDMKRI